MIGVVMLLNDGFFKSPRCSLAKGRSAGFTLLELMITVVIIGILASIALPSYQNYVRRGKMPEAFNYLSTHALKMEQFYQNNSTYLNGTNCGVAVANTTYFTMACPSPTATTFTVTATGTGSMAGYDYTITQSGAKGTTKFAGTTVSGKTCWMTKAGDC